MMECCLLSLLDRAILVHPTYRSHVEPSFIPGGFMIDKILDNQDVMGVYFVSAVAMDTIMLVISLWHKALRYTKIL